MNRIEHVISKIRQAHPDNEDMYLFGRCYEFAMILRTIFGAEEFWYDPIDPHIYTRIDGIWYDIQGKHLKLPHYCHVIDWQQEKPWNWGRVDRRRLVDLSTPVI